MLALANRGDRRLGKESRRQVHSEVTPGPGGLLAADEYTYRK